MSPKKPPNSTPRARTARPPKPSPKPRRKPALGPAAMAKRLAARTRYTGKSSPTKVLRKLRDAASGDARPADETEDLFAILSELVNATCVIRTVKRSLEHGESAWDEVASLEAAIKMLRRVDVALNDVADGRPARIKPTDEDEDTTDDEGDE